MKLLSDETLLRFYLDKYGIEHFFDTPDLPFRLSRLEKGEILSNLRDANQFLFFIVSGAFRIYTVRSDGSRYLVSYQDSFTFLGDVEFCGIHRLHSLVEAASEVLCIELPLYDCRAALLNDRAFLRYLAGSLAKKLADFSQHEADYSTLQEKLLHYITYECPDRTLRGTEKAAGTLHCSRRQLQRILRELTDSGHLERTGKGIYRISLDN